MKKVLKYSLFGLALAVGASATAHADPWRRHDAHRLEARTAPEVDPALAVSGLALLGGAIAVLNARLRK